MRFVNLSGVRELEEWKEERAPSGDRVEANECTSLLSRRSWLGYGWQLLRGARMTYLNPQDLQKLNFKSLNMRLLSYVQAVHILTHLDFVYSDLCNSVLSPSENPLSWGYRDWQTLKSSYCRGLELNSWQPHEESMGSDISDFCRDLHSCAYTHTQTHREAHN